MLIHIEQGKGDKNRNAMLSPVLLQLMREWWRTAQAEHKMLKGGWLFPVQDPVNPVTTRQLHRACCASVTLTDVDTLVSAKRWLEARQLELLPVDYYHVVFTLPAIIADIAYQNKREVYGILCKAAAETLRTIALDPKHLGAKIGVTMVLHTWGSALTHHPHVHCIVPGGGFSDDGQQWLACRKGFFLPVRVLSRLFRRVFLEKLMTSTATGRYSSLVTNRR